MKQPELANYYLQQMGIDTWVLRNKTTTLTPAQPLYARGNPSAKLMIIADAPRDDDHSKGQLFSGKTHILLKNMLKSIDLTEQDVYLTTLQRDDSADVSAERLFQDIAQVSPELIVVLGDATSNCLQDVVSSLNDSQQTVTYFRSIPVLKSIHPADLLKYPYAKKQAYADLLLMKELL